MNTTTFQSIDSARVSKNFPLLMTLKQAAEIIGVAHEVIDAASKTRKDHPRLPTTELRKPDDWATEPFVSAQSLAEWVDECQKKVANDSQIAELEKLKKEKAAYNKYWQDESKKSKELKEKFEELEKSSKEQASAFAASVVPQQERIKELEDEIASQADEIEELREKLEEQPQTFTINASSSDRASQPDDVATVTYSPVAEPEPGEPEPDDEDEYPSDE